MYLLCKTMKSIDQKSFLTNFCVVYFICSGTSEILESVKLTNEQILNSNTSLSLLKSDIDQLRLTCLEERAAHTELISVLNYNSDLLVADRKDDAYSAKPNDNSTRVVYYKVIVEECEWSLGMCTHWRDSELIVEGAPTRGVPSLFSIIFIFEIKVNLVCDTPLLDSPFVTRSAIPQ